MSAALRTASKSLMSFRIFNAKDFSLLGIETIERHQPGNVGVAGIVFVAAELHVRNNDVFTLLDREDTGVLRNRRLTLRRSKPLDDGAGTELHRNLHVQDFTLDLRPTGNLDGPGQSLQRKPLSVGESVDRPTAIASGDSKSERPFAAAVDQMLQTGSEHDSFLHLGLDEADIDLVVDV